MESGAQMKHVHVRPQQNGWMVLSVEVCCSRIGEGFGSVGFQFGAGVRPGNRLAGGEVGSSGRQNPPWPPPRIAAQSETDLARFIQVSSPRGPVVGTGGGQSRAASQEWRASPSGTGYGVALCGRQAPSGEGPTPAGSHGSGADRDGQRCFASMAIGVGGFHPLQE